MAKNIHTKNMSFKQLIAIQIFALCGTSLAYTQNLSVAQSGNIVQIKSEQFGNFILFGDPGFNELSAYEFSIDVSSSSNKKKPLQPKKEEEKSDHTADIDNLLIQANQLYNRHKFIEALSIVEEAVRMRPDSAKAKAMRGSLKNVLGDKDGALKDWREANQLESSDQKLKKQLEKQLPRP